MKRLILRRPTPATAIASVALFVSLGGVSYGVATGSIDSREIKDNSVRTQDIARGGVHASDVRNDSIRTEDLRNNEVRGLDIRNSTIRGIEIALNSITGSDIAESSLETVPSATTAATAGTAATARTADTLDGLDSSAFARPEDLGRFSLKLGDGETRVVATHGQVSVTAQCIDGGARDEVRLYATTTSDGALMDGEDANDDHLTQATALTAATIPTSAELAVFLRSPAATTAAVDDSNGGGFVVGPDGRGLHLQGGSTILGFDYGGGTCLAAGELSKTG